MGAPTSVSPPRLGSYCTIAHKCCASGAGVLSAPKRSNDLLALPPDYLRPLFLQRDECRRHLIEISNCFHAPFEVRGQRAKVFVLTLYARLHSCDQAVDFPKSSTSLGSASRVTCFPLCSMARFHPQTMNVEGRAKLPGRNTLLAPQSNPRCQGLTVSSRKEGNRDGNYNKCRATDAFLCTFPH